MSVRFLSVLAVLLCSISGADEIPLDQIWAHMMPGTKKIQELELQVPDDDRLMAKIGRVLYQNMRQKTGTSFAVEGIGLGGLENAERVLCKDEKREISFSPESEISIVFYTHYSNFYAHLSKVDVDGYTIEIRYQLVPHLTQDLTAHFALIPIGKLPKGDYKVKVIAEPTDQKFIEAGFQKPRKVDHSTIASSSFSFQVE